MTRVGIVAHHERDEARRLARSLSEWLADRGHTSWVPHVDARSSALDDLASIDPLGSADVVVSIGGDGTVLRAIELLDGAETPIIAVNLGSLAYLTEVEPHAVTSALERFFAGDCRTEERMLLDVALLRAGSGVPDSTWRALNEAVIEKEESGHTVRLLVNIDGEPFTSYAADGMIVATPTGSTAYSLSARGPVISPMLHALLLTPVSPHQLFDRSLVLTPDEAVGIELAGHRTAALTVDGRRVATLGSGDLVRCQRSTARAHFVCFGKRRFHEVLRAKFGLADR